MLGLKVKTKINPDESYEIMFKHILSQIDNSCVVV